MEVMTHTLYFNSIAKHKLWQRYAAELHLTALHVGMTGFWVLVFMWLKVRLAHISTDLCKMQGKGASQKRVFEAQVLARYEQAQFSFLRGKAPKVLVRQLIQGQIYLVQDTLAQGRLCCYCRRYGMQ